MRFTQRAADLCELRDRDFLALMSGAGTHVDVVVIARAIDLHFESRWIARRKSRLREHRELLAIHRLLPERVVDHAIEHAIEPEASAARRAPSDPLARAAEAAQQRGTIGAGGVDHKIEVLRAQLAHPADVREEAGTFRHARIFPDAIDPGRELEEI